MLAPYLRAAAALVLVALTGCASAPQALYSWNGYNDHVYSYLKGGASPEQQMLAMEQAIAQAKPEQPPLPPGYYAHLGLMYMNAGSTDRALDAWAEEKRRFPESAPYIDYLIRNLKKNKG